MYSALEVARYIIWYCNKKNYVVSNLKLQKILYFVQAQFLVFVDDHKPCFSESIMAWPYGPVVPEVYYEYKIYGSAQIPCIDCEDDSLITEEHKEIINEMIKRCAKYSASQLVEITHQQAPWKDVYVTGKRDIVIENQAIIDFFSH